MNKDKIITIMVVGGLLLVAVLLICFKLYVSTPHYEVYTNESLGYSLLIPASWGASYVVAEQDMGASVLFDYQPSRGEPNLIFGVFKTSLTDWENLRAEPLFSSVSRELGRVGNQVYYARWLANNPYQGIEGKKYLALVRDISIILNSFILKTRAAVEEPPTDFCIQVITPAKNIATGEIKEFPTPCDVPEGWEILNP